MRSTLAFVVFSLSAALFCASCSSTTGGDCRTGAVRCAESETCTEDGRCISKMGSELCTRDAECPGGACVNRRCSFDGGIADGGEGNVDGGGPPASDGGAAATDGGAATTDGGAGECESGSTEICGSKVGVCRYGSRLCIEGRFGACVGGVAPSPEICDGLDNDCNGTIDDRTPPCECRDGEGRECGTSIIGDCRKGRQSCVDGRYGMCLGNVEPAVRFCDDRDRDCDGNPDYLQPPCTCKNGDLRSCGSALGVCRQGSQTCVSGIWGTCTGATNPVSTNPNEGAAGLCNGLDDNCDGMIDEGCGCVPPTQRPCGSSIGECREGTQICLANGTYGTCTGNVAATAPQCDALDRNCNGTADFTEAATACECRNGTSRACGSSQGVCRLGTQTCVIGRWDACSGGTGPTTALTSEGAASLCNGLDDNCDGNVDEGCGCTSGQTQPCGTDTGECVAGMQTCTTAGTWGACGGVSPTTRQCDDKDRDCNGTIDYLEAPCQCRSGDTRSCGSGVGVCRMGTQTCVSGTFGVCTGAIGPTTTNVNEGSAGLCNGLDDNCSGAADEGCGCVPPASQACGSDTGECVAGTRSCRSDGTYGPCNGSVGTAPRQCDDKDRDCDGVVDYTQTPCLCRNGDTQPCGSNVGVCTFGTRTCSLGAWGACLGGVASTPEICDGLDNDCSGAPDDGLRAPTAVACWTNTAGALVCADPSVFSVAPLVTVQLDGRQSSDPDGQSLGYTWRIASAPAGSTVAISNATSATPTLFAQLAGDYRICLIVSDTTSCRSAESCVTMHVVPSSRIHIQLVWDKDETDLDLHFLLGSIANLFDDGQGPIGDPTRCNRALDCHFVCRTPNWGAGGATDNPRLDIDDLDGLGPENVNLDAPFNQNPYVIAVHYWCDIPPLSDGVPRGDTTATIRVYIDGILASSFSRRLSVGEAWYVADLRWTNGMVPPYVITSRDTVAPSINGCPL